MYTDYVIERINKVLKDEITTSIVYLRMAESLVGVNTEEVSEILKEHATEEFGHFNQILTFAYSHGLTPIIDVDTEKINKAPSDLMQVMNFTQDLEKIAIADYKELANLAKENNDIESMEFFTDLMTAETEHFDDMSPLTGQKRGINEDFKVKSLSEVLEEMSKEK